ncbi:hypothetical protein BSY19_5166 (plasmid) [Bosea sp. RAC05]|nr:hypothetical protein BSY19_5166 [Bosea sp. RAC05]
MDSDKYRAFLPAWLTVTLMHRLEVSFAFASLIVTLIPEKSAIIDGPARFKERICALDVDQMRAVVAYGRAIQGDPGIAKFTGMDAGARIVEVWTVLVEDSVHAPQCSIAP